MTKPLRPQEVLARIAAHMHNARQMKQARTALDAFGQATLAIAAASRLVWQTPLARDILQPPLCRTRRLRPERLLAWTPRRRARPPRRPGSPRPGAHPARLPPAGVFHDQTGDEEWLVVLREENDDSTLEAPDQRLSPHRREVVLHWLTLGKTNRDIADILGGSPRTVNKHLEHIFEKLGVGNPHGGGNAGG